MAQEDKDHFLSLIRQRRRGRLKVYIGMIAGVGKTYRMLQEAQELLRSGIDVKIGLVETHGREETESLLTGLPSVPLKTVFYKSRALQEMDLDAILGQHPEVVIIDELAHTNVPGGKNKKRWQDVQDILENGINVITAFNVQHLESVNDRVELIAGIQVSETIPDKILEWADEVVNIDLPAEDLIKRLKEGKIYKGERIQRALDNYFQPETILQLRDLALRKVASQVERKIEKDLHQRMILERFLACISTNYEGGKRIIRKTARLADYYQARWFVIYVKTPREAAYKISLADQRRLLKNLNWARELGAEVITVSAEDVPRAIFDKTKELKITNVVTGRPHFSLWRQLSGRNYFDRLLKLLIETEIDVIIVS